jgi:drug/metabolite transporter (DMT)-like permease
MEKRGEWILLLVPLLFGTTYALIRVALRDIPASFFVSLRFLSAALCFLPIVFLSQRFRKEIWHALPSGILLGMVAAGFYLLQTLGLKTVPAPRGAFITSADALFVPVLALFFRDFRTTLADWVSVFVAIIGLYFLLEPNHGGMTYGDALILICAVVIALHIHLVQKVVLFLMIRK